MHCASLLELLKKEHEICEKLKDRVNILEGYQSAVADGVTDYAEHKALSCKLGDDIAMLNDALYPLRLAIGAKIMDYQGMAERAIAENLRDADGNGAGGEACTDPMQEGLSRE